MYLVISPAFAYNRVKPPKELIGHTACGSSLSPTERRLEAMSSASRPDDSEDPASHEFEVLVVQSNPVDTLLTVEAFKAAGLTSGLRCVTDGEDALMYVRREGKYARNRIPDLIFLDLSQPKLSGLGVLKLIKSTKELMHIPIVVAAGSDDPKFIRAVYELNGNCFIRKPGELNEFARFIESCYQFWSRIVTLCPNPTPHNRSHTGTVAP
jgi:chemotaxis family two-component system response regulator Rcp1